ncbi:DinB family protein [Metabacillus sp. KIGAM252]|uniref:DinB family protein n=1 Tax=Metabacillus flavus TaxID=2823519 RepID=A0ABS5LBM5_9BACI|nr:DinB family protein [Metabacillus flavus]MBS2967864.1 DinB family protein [Metabacillus flavus]
MEHFLFNQLAFVRNQTLKQLEGVTEDMADRIPDGFRNSIRWNAGHVYVVLERFAFSYIGLPQVLPDGFKEQFEYGSTPLNGHSFPVPTLNELKELMESQQSRIREELSGRLEEKVPAPYTTSAGMTLETVEQFLTFSLYHEGMHVDTIKMYKTLLARKQ